MYDRDNLDDSEYSVLSEGDRVNAEAQMRRRDRDEGRAAGGMRRGYLYGVSYTMQCCTIYVINLENALHFFM